MKPVKGSFTVEAALIIPVVSFVIITLLYIIIFLHDRTCLQAIVNQAVNKTALECIHQVTINGHQPVPYHTKKNKGLYWRLRGKYYYNEADISIYIYKEIKKQLVMKELRDISITCKLKRSLLGSYVHLTVVKDAKTALKPINQLMKSPNFPLKLCVDSKAYIHEPTEVIRNAHLLTQLLDELNYDKLKKFIKP